MPAPAKLSAAFFERKEQFMTLRLGYVGAGFMAQKVHLPNFASLDSCSVTALAEAREDLRGAVADRFGIAKRYASHTELAADPEIDAVAVSADYSQQNVIAEELLLAGKPVFMEKPMATTLARADAILKAEKIGGSRLMVGYMKRYDAGNQLAKEAIQGFRKSGELGNLTFMRNHGFCGDWIGGLDTPFTGSSLPMPPTKTIVPDWLPEKYNGSYLGYLQQWTHNLNLMRWLLDAGDDVHVRAVDFDADGMTGVVILEIAGVRATLESGSISHYRWDEHTQVYFQNGWVKTDAPPLLLRQTPADVEIYRAGKTQEFTRPIPQPAWTWSYKCEAEHFVDGVLSGAPFDSSAEDTRTDVRLYEEIYRTWLNL
jgi:predicted dehydrogenase